MLNPQALGFLPKLVIVLAILLIAAGVLWHGVTWETFPRAWRNMVGRDEWAAVVPLHPAAINGCNRRDP